MAIQKTDKIWHNGKLINWDDATIHVMSHVIHYGSSVFEGIRCYELPSGPAIFRADEHMQRLLDSAKVYRMDVDFTRERTGQGHARDRRPQRRVACYVRPIVLRGYGEAGVNPFNSPTEVYIINYPWGKYLGGESRRLRRLRLVVDAAGAQHAARHGQGRRELYELAAHQDGGHRQRLRGGHRARRQRVRQRGLGRKYVPRASRQADHGAAGESVLPGITRDSVLQIARDLDIPIVEQMIPREMLYIADEVFFTGTAAEITAIRSVDKIKVGKGGIGPVTKALQKEFYAIVRGEKSDRHGWFTPVPVKAQQAAGRRIIRVVDSSQGRGLLDAARPFGSLSRQKRSTHPRRKQCLSKV